MNAEHRARKQAIRAFFIHYTDERLAMLLAHAQEGRLAFHSCCCFIGVTTADHALQPQVIFDLSEPFYSHYRAAEQIPGAFRAERSFQLLGRNDDAKRRRILIPMIRAEFHRRSSMRRSPVREEVLSKCES
jgi:hypothetical protein